MYRAGVVAGHVRKPDLRLDLLLQAPPHEDAAEEAFLIEEEGEQGRLNIVAAYSEATGLDEEAEEAQSYFRVTEKLSWEKRETNRSHNSKSKCNEERKKIELEVKKVNSSHLQDQVEQKVSKQ